MVRETSPERQLRVAEFAAPGSGIASAYAGSLLQGMGAEVTRLVPAANLTDQAASPRTLALEALAAGKGALPCPSPAPRDGRPHPLVTLADELAGFDILLCDQLASRPIANESLAALADRYPDLIIGVASTFGLDGPYRDVPGSSLDAQALSGVAWAMGEPGRAPLTLPPGILEHQAGAMLASGCLLASIVGGQSGNGQIVDISLADTLASYVAGNCRFFIHHGLEWRRSGRRASGSGGAYPYMLLPCKDGEVCVCGRTRDEWNRLVGAMGNPAWAAEPRYQNLRAMGKEYPDEVDALVIPWFAEHTKAELAAVALEHGLIVSPIRNFEEVLATPHFTASGFFSPGSLAGRSTQVPGLPFRATERRSPDSENIASQLLRTAPPIKGTIGADAPRPDGRGAPLAGLRVLDLGWVWSAPWVSTILGELGAEVIKVEHAPRPDNLRLAGRVFRDGKRVEGPSKEMSPMFHQVNHGKLGITLNAKTARGRALLLELASLSDVVIENMSPGSLERSELGYEAFSAVNPRIVMLAMSAAGQFGELSDMRAYAPTMSSFVGMEALVGYAGEAPIGALNFGLSDPSASVHGLVPLLAAVRRARAVGRGCYIDLSQLEALLGTLRPYLLEAQVEGRQSPTIGNAHPEIAPHGIYPCSGEDQWLALTARGEAQWGALVGLAAGATWVGDPRFSSNASRLEHRDVLDAAIAGWTAPQLRDELVENLRAAGLAATPVLSVEEQWQDPHYAARDLKHPVEIPVYGREDMFRAPWRFSEYEPEITRCGPTTGEHNQYVYGELLGLEPDEIASLQESGVIA